MTIPFPTTGKAAIITCTGFTTPVQVAGSAAKSIIVTARRVISGLSGGASTNNSDVVLIGVGFSPVGLTEYQGIPLLAGETIELNVADAGMIYVAGAVGDTVVVMTIV